MLNPKSEIRYSKSLIVIIGPTAIGKTALAIRIAQQLNTEIISADSRQFYREMNIGTAKPSADELNAVKHHFINSHSIDEDFSVGDFERFGSAILNDIFRRKDTAVLVGGSGLYINALCEGFDELPKADPAIRERLNRQFLEEGIGVLQAQLYESDPEYYKKADLLNPQRLIRALEVCLSTGKPFSSYHTKQKKRGHLIS
jgi:tRNA dimethylallyltransferase